MLKVVWNVLKKICGVVFIILSPLKRLFCRRKRKNSDTLLPLTNHYTIPDDFGQVPSESQGELEAWDTWESENQSANSKINNYHGNQYSRPRTTSRQNSEPEPDVDFFTDMAPDIKKQKRILVKKKQDSQSSNLASKFAVTSDVPLTTGSELESWDDKGSAWDAVAEEDLSWQAEAELKEKRRLERIERNLEQQKRKQEKEQKPGRKDGQFSAVRLS